MSKMAKITAALVACGFGVERACFHAEKLSSELGNSKSPTSAPKRVPSAGLEVQPTLKERIMSYATSRRGNEWELSGVTLALGASRNAISAQITHLLKEGLINRTGRAKYVKNYNKN